MPRTCAKIRSFAGEDRPSNSFGGVKSQIVAPKRWQGTTTTKETTTCFVGEHTQVSCIFIINPSAGLCPPVTLPVATFHLVPDSSNKISHVHPKRRQAVSNRHCHRFLHRLRGILIPRLAASSHHHQLHSHPQRSIILPIAMDDVDHETLPLLHNHGLHQQQIAHLSRAHPCLRQLPFGLRQY